MTKLNYPKSKQITNTDFNVHHRDLKLQNYIICNSPLCQRVPYPQWCSFYLSSFFKFTILQMMVEGENLTLYSKSIKKNPTCR